jgi:hypothetical protein
VRESSVNNPFPTVAEVVGRFEDVVTALDERLLRDRLLLIFGTDVTAATASSMSSGDNGGDSSSSTMQLQSHCVAQLQAVQVVCQQQLLAHYETQFAVWLRSARQWAERVVEQRLASLSHQLDSSSLWLLRDEEVVARLQDVQDAAWSAAGLTAAVTSTRTAQTAAQSVSMSLKLAVDDALVVLTRHFDVLAAPIRQRLAAQVQSTREAVAATLEEVCTEMTAFVAEAPIVLLESLTRGYSRTALETLLNKEHKRLTGLLDTQLITLLHVDPVVSSLSFSLSLFLSLSLTHTHTLLSVQLLT